MPARMDENFRRNGHLYCGALPYSEGIYEDINKAMMLAFYAGRLDNAADVLREYTRFEFCLDGEYVEDFVKMVFAMEHTLRRHAADETGAPFRWQDNAIAYEKLRIVIDQPEDAPEIERLAAKIDAKLPETIRSGWRWQILRLRAAIDAELAGHDMYFTDRFEDCMERLTKIYHAEEAFHSVTPLTRAAVSRGHNGQII